jgi:hypothetical protein
MRLPPTVRARLASLVPASMLATGPAAVATVLHVCQQAKLAVLARPVSALPPPCLNRSNAWGRVTRSMPGAVVGHAKHHLAALQPGLHFRSGRRRRVYLAALPTRLLTTRPSRG